MQSDTGHQPIQHRGLMPTGGTAPSVAPDDSASVRTPPKHPHQRRTAGHLGEWKRELALLLLSILSLAAAVVTLYKLQSTRLESWTFFLGLNTVISVLAAISWASLAFAVSSCIEQAKWNWYRRREDRLIVFERFDEASKGPWGGSRLLGTTCHWSALGAVIVVVLLAYEPFLQSIIEQYGALDADPTGAQGATGQCSRLDSGRVAFSPAGLISLPGIGIESCAGNVVVSQPAFSLTAAVYSGFQGAMEKRRINGSVDCPTSNCTFADFVSLGVCSRCADVSPYVTQHRAVYNATLGDDGSDLDNMCTSHNWYSSVFDHNYTVSSVGNVNLTNHDGRANMAGNDVCGLDGTAAYLATASTRDVSRAYRVVGNMSDSTAFVLFQALWAPNAYVQGVQEWEDAVPTAWECALSFCAQQYTVGHADGRTTERLLTTWEEPVADSYQLLKCDAHLRAGASQWVGTSMSKQLLLLGDRADFQVAVLPGEVGKAPSGLPPEGMRFNVSQASVVSIVDWFEATFSRKMVYPATRKVTATGIAEILYNASSTQTPLEDGEAVFATMASSMSAWMRDTALVAHGDNSSSSPPVRGPAQRWTIHYGVRWPFLTLPAVLELAGVVFVALSIWETRALAPTPWKDSALATMAYGLDGAHRDLLKETGTPDRMSRRARGMRVRMVGGSIVHVPRGGDGDGVPRRDRDS